MDIEKLASRLHILKVIFWSLLPRFVLEDSGFEIFGKCFFEIAKDYMATSMFKKILL